MDGIRRSPTLLAIKTHMPVTQSGLIHRSGLVQRLSSEQPRALTVVRAPAGYGKSTLLQQWAENDNTRHFAWVGLEPSENDPILFWRYIVAAIRTQVPGFGDSANHMLTSGAPDLDAVLFDLLNELLDVDTRTVLILDDYHEIVSTECHRTLQLFVDHLPRTAEIALVSRTQPPISVSRLLSRGLLTEIDQSDLQFSAAETHEAIRLVTPFASAEDLSRIHGRTEGWPVGVYLATRSRSSNLTSTRSLRGDTAATQRYVVDEILSQLPDGDQIFLKETSILGSMTGDLCDHITGRADSTETLATYASANLLLIPLDERGQWYRYHHLLLDALRAQPQTDGDEVEQVLHSRASDWWLAHGDASLAIHHAIEASELKTAGDLISANWADYVLNGRIETANRWLVHYPEDVIVDHPPMTVAAAWISALRGDTDKTLRFAEAAERATYAGDVPDGAHSFESSVALLLAALGLHGVNDALEHAETAYRLEPPNSPWRPMAAALTGTIRAAIGRTEDARSALVEATRTPAGPDGVTTYALGQLALLEASEGRWDAAYENARRGCDLIDELGLQDLLSSGAAYTALAAVAAHRGNAFEARRQLHLITSLQGTLSDAIPFDAFQLHLITAEIYFAIGDDGAARVHADASATWLRSLGDGGILAARLETLVDQLGSSGEPTPEVLKSPEPLTTRERQILTLLPTALSVREIGHELYVSRNTAKTHVSRIYRKLGVSTRTAAIARARELELI